MDPDPGAIATCRESGCNCHVDKEPPRTEADEGMGLAGKQLHKAISYKYTLDLPPTQDSSHHQDYSIFSRESL